MKRLIYEVPRWSLYLHRDARSLPSAAFDDVPLRQLEDELFERLFAGEAEPLREQDRHKTLGDWAQKLHAQCDGLPDFSRLANEVRGDAFMSALAVEKLVEQLNPELPATPQNLRRQVSSGCKKAGAAVDDAREMLEGLAGTGAGSRSKLGTPANKGLLNRLRSDPRLQRVAKMAGRFKRIASGKLRQKVRHAHGEVCDIERGNDLARLLPTELGRLLHPRQRLAFLRDLHERSAMQYAMRGPANIGRGPLVVVIDRSGSMEGERDVWATAVALALLEIAQREKRPFAVIAFDAAVKFKCFVPVGQTLPEAALLVGCDGGTDIHLALSEALKLIRFEEPALRKADVVLISDGMSDADGAAALREAAKTLGVSMMGLAIQMPAENLRPWCDEVESVDRVDQLDEKTAEKLFAT